MGEELQQSIINRLHRIEGQIRGIEKMVYQKKSNAQLIQQLEATKSAANQIIIALIEERFSDKTKITPEDLEDLKRFIKRI